MNRSAPFSHIGVDLAGPILINQDDYKAKTGSLYLMPFHKDDSLRTRRRVEGRKFFTIAKKSHRAQKETKIVTIR